ncbi:MAG: S-layer homology domain-containing protein [Acidimicrobiia bacterium]|nr:S-layer homology domain-containing protein [Acidimicrobiia bacterium]
MRRSGWRSGFVALTAMVLVLTGTVVASAEYDSVPPPPGGTFSDDDQFPEEGFIEAIAGAGITVGCNPPANDRFCPDLALTRAEMASFLVRALQLPPSPDNPFSDDAGSNHEEDINALAAAGITVGCNPPDHDRFCPGRPVTRGEMAAFLVRGFGYAEDPQTDFFIDDAGSPFETDINRLAAAGVTAGCDGDRYCPAATVPRRQMAVFLARALDLSAQVPAPRPAPPYPDVGEGKRIIYANAEHRVWLIDENGQLVDTYPVSGREGIPAPGTYQVFSKSVEARALTGGITMRHMVRFAYGPRVPYGFHSIPRWPDGRPLQTEEEIGEFLSGGCVRQPDVKAEALYNWAPIGTTVILLP